MIVFLVGRDCTVSANMSSGKTLACSKRKTTSNNGSSDNVKRPKATQKFSQKYLKVPGITSSRLGDKHAYCKYCKTDFRISHGGIRDVANHVNTKKHDKFMELAKVPAADQQKMDKFMNPTPESSTSMSPHDANVIKAEVIITRALVKMNVPLSTADTITKTVAAAFPDSKIAQDYKCCRNKTTAIVQCIADTVKGDLKDKLTVCPFSVSTDGSNDQREKQFPVVVTTVGKEGVETTLLSVPTLVSVAATGKNIFDLVEQELGVLVQKAVELHQQVLVGRDQPLPSQLDADRDAGNADVAVEEDGARGLLLKVPWNNCLSLSCDNANVMVGAKNGVYAHMKKKQQNLHLAGCPCHLLHRAAEKACTAVPFNVDENLVDVYYHLDKSSKRLAALEQFQDEVKHKKILKHVSTRWLSVRKCIDRLLENWEALRQFSASETPNTSSTAGARLDRLRIFFKSPTNKLYCMFLSHSLELFDVLNMKLQNEAPQIHTLHRLLNQFLRDCLVRFVKPSAMTGKLAIDVEFDQDHQVKSDSDLMIGEAARGFIRRKKEVHLREPRLKSIFVDVKTKFPLTNEVLKHAKVKWQIQRSKMKMVSHKAWISS